jgi:hypothetical protein
MLQLIYTLKKHNWGFPTPPQPRISFERGIFYIPIFIILGNWIVLEKQQNHAA